MFAALRLLCTTDFKLAHAPAPSQEDTDTVIGIQLSDIPSSEGSGVGFI